MFFVFYSLPTSTALNIKQGLQLDNQLPLLVGHLLAVKLLEGVNALS